MALFAKYYTSLPPDPDGAPANDDESDLRCVIAELEEKVVDLQRTSDERMGVIEELDRAARERLELIQRLDAELRARTVGEVLADPRDDRR